jgi:hypothetical protein
MFPAAPILLSRLSAGGALATCWSGAGPSLLGICRGADGAKVKLAAEEAMEDTEVPGKVLLLSPDMHGLIVDRSGTDDFFRSRQPSWPEAGTGGFDGEGGSDADPVPDSGGRLFDFDGDR